MTVREREGWGEEATVTKSVSYWGLGSISGCSPDQNLSVASIASHLFTDGFGQRSRGRERGGRKKQKGKKKLQTTVAGRLSWF